MASWIGSNKNAKTLSIGDRLVFHLDSFSYLNIQIHDSVFIVDGRDSTILYGWGTVLDTFYDERLVLGDDDEAHSPPYPTYFKITVWVSCNEVFIFPMLLASYLSAREFQTYTDEYQNRYEQSIQKLSTELANKLDAVTSYRPKSAIPLFLSYAREDYDIARKLYQSLSKNGYHVWLDRESLIPGQNWRIEIAKAIRESQAFIALLSNNSINKRGYVQKELSLGLEVLDEIPPSKIYLIPVRLESCAPKHARLNDLHWVDLFPNFESGLSKLIFAIQTLEQSKL